MDINKGSISKLIKVLIARISGTGYGFLVTFALSRIYGPTGAAVYFIFLSWRRMFQGINSGGAAQFISRNVARTEIEEKSSLKMVLKCLVYSLIAAFVTFLIYFIVISFTSIDNQLVIGIAILGGIGYGSLRMVCGALRGVGLAQLSITLEYSAPPFFLLLAISVVYFYGLESVITSTGVIVTLALIYFLAAAYGFYKYHGRLVGQGNSSWKFGDLPFFWLNNNTRIFVAQFPMLFLSIVESDIGVIADYGLSFRIVTMAAAILSVLSSLFERRIVRQFDATGYEGIPSLLLRSQLLSVSLFFPFFIVMFFFSDFVLSIFGNGFMTAVVFLKILSFAQLVNSATGLNNVFLSMIGEERYSARLSSIFSILCIVSVPVSYFMWGVTSMIIAIALLQISQNVLSYTKLLTICRGKSYDAS